jgi:hypothetical protein
MYRWPLLLGLALCAILIAANPAMLVRSAGEPVDREAMIQRDRERILAAAEELGLHWVCDSKDLVAGRKLILSDFPVSHERQVCLNINHSHFTRWRGTIAVYLGASTMWAANHDPEHPDRCAMVGESFIYGDPEMIERVRSAMP